MISDNPAPVAEPVGQPSSGTGKEPAVFADTLPELLARLEAAEAERDALKHRLASKSEFLVNMSHELKTPLTSILGFLDMLAMADAGTLNNRQQRYLARIRANSHHMLGLVNNFLDLSRIEAGWLPLAPERFSLRAAVNDGVALLLPLAAETRIACTVDVDNAVIEADPRLFRQILLNLLSNALKFTPPDGRVGVLARREACGQITDCLRLTVWDKGIGILPHLKDLIFEEFRQFGRPPGPQGQASSRLSLGTGLGLTITRKLVLLHGGTISVDSTPGEGSAFTVLIPQPLPSPGPSGAGDTGASGIREA